MNILYELGEIGLQMSLSDWKLENWGLKLKFIWFVELYIFLKMLIQKLVVQKLVFYSLKLH